MSADDDTAGPQELQQITTEHDTREENGTANEISENGPISENGEAKPPSSKELLDEETKPPLSSGCEELLKEESNQTNQNEVGAADSEAGAAAQSCEAQHSDKACTPKEKEKEKEQTSDTPQTIPSSAASSSRDKRPKPSKGSEVFVGGLHRDATEEEIREVFSKIGEIYEVPPLFSPFFFSYKWLRFCPPKAAFDERPEDQQEQRLCICQIHRTYASGDGGGPT